MPLIRIDLAPDGRLPAAAAARLDAGLRAHRHGPVLAMLHGFRFSPHAEALSPHRHILSLDPEGGDRRAVSWPRHLGFGRSTEEGLAIAVGWEARGTLWQAWASAARAGAGLAQIAERLEAVGDARALDIVAHSMGARVALAGIAQAGIAQIGAGRIGRVLLLAAAEFTRNAARAAASPAGRRADFVNVTTRENDLFDLGLELALGGAFWSGLGRGLPEAPGNWVDLDLDCADTRAGLGALGFAIAPAHRRICHWSPYLRPGVFALYRAILRERGRTSIAHLRAAVPPGTPPPRRLARLIPPRPGMGSGATA